MIRVIISNRILVEEDRLGLIKRYAMLSLIFATLTLIPFEANITHMYIVSIIGRNVNIYGSNARVEGAAAFCRVLSLAGMIRNCLNN